MPNLPQLKAFVASAYTLAELRVLVQDRFRALDEHIHWGQGKTFVVAELVELLVSRGLLSQLRPILLAEREARAAEIEALWSTEEVEDGGAPRRRSVPLGVVWLAILVALLLSGWAAARWLL